MTQMDIFRNQVAEGIYRELFCRLYNLEVPLLALNKISHWQAVVAKLGLIGQELHGMKTYVAGGLFYGISSRVPNHEGIKEIMATASEAEADAILFPLVRDAEDSAALTDAGFLKFPWFHESIYELQKTLEQDLLAQVGKSQLKDVLRLQKKAERFYRLDIHGYESIQAHPRYVQELEAVLNKNVSKYQHVANPYSAPMVKWLLQTPFADNLKIALRSDLATHSYVQGSVALVDEKSQQMLQLVQGIEHDQVRSGHNLYIAETLQLYQWGIERGVKSFNLGRGALSLKRRLGANRVHRLANYLLPLKTYDRKQVGILQELCHRHLESEEGGLNLQ